jgi:outer membrane protein assembly factor BamB
MVPALALLSLVALSGLLRLKGFNGEMLPQFEFRFAEQPPEIRSLGDQTSPGVVIDPASESVSAEADSLGFLGTDRTGVVRPRLFSVPSNASQVETLWNQGSGEGWSSFAVSGDRAVTLEQRKEMECVTCYRLSDGQLLWIVDHEARHQHPLGGIGPRSTPTIVGQRVYAQGATGRLWCLDLGSGEINWTVDLLELAGWDQTESEAAIMWGRAGSPLVVDGLCVVPYGGPDANAETGRSLIALDAETGKTRWTAGEDQISFASPGLFTLGGQRQIVSVNEKTISGHNVADGKLLWDFEWPGQSNAGANCAMIVAAGQDRFLIGKGYSGGSALVQLKARKNGTLAAEAIWDSMRVLKTKFTHACVDGPIAYAISNGSLEAVMIDQGDQLWRQSRRQRFGQGQILLVEDTIVAQSETGEVVFVAADPGEYRELVRLPAMDSKTWNIPTIAGRHLLVRNDRQAICFLLPERRDPN